MSNLSGFAFAAALALAGLVAVVGGLTLADYLYDRRERARFNRELAAEDDASFVEFDKRAERRADV